MAGEQGTMQWFPVTVQDPQGGTEVWGTSETLMSHSHPTSADLHGPTDGTSELGGSAEAKNVTSSGWRLGG